MKRNASLGYEKKLWNLGYKIVAGADEVGRGCFAGPVVCGCVVFPKNISKRWRELKENNVIINDSKKLTPNQRVRADEWIKDNALSYGVGVGTPAEINRRGIAKTTASGFRRAIAMTNVSLTSRSNFLLIDAFYIPYVRGISIPKKIHRKFTTAKEFSKSGQQLAIVHGDEKSFSIAAASIVAKVYRDKLMVKLSNALRYRKYGWDKNKGYGTKLHQEAILKYGTTRLHRKKFVESFVKKLT